MGAKLMEIPELELTKEEGGRLTRAVKEVAKHYNVAMDPKKLAIFQLVAVAGGIYGPRAVAIYRRSNRQRPQLINIEPKQPAPKEPSAAPRANGPVPIRLFTPSQMDMSTPIDGFDE